MRSWITKGSEKGRQSNLEIAALGGREVITPRIKQKKGLIGHRGGRTVYTERKSGRKSRSETQKEECTPRG